MMCTPNKERYPQTLAAQILGPELPALARTARRYTRDPHDADDLVQDTLVLALRFYDHSKAGANLGAWLRKVMRNRHISLARRRTLEKRVFEREAGHALRDWSVGSMGRLGANPHGGIDAGGFSDPVERAIADLRPEFREVVMLCDVEGLSYSEAAQRTMRPIGTIMSRLHRGRKALRQKLVSRQALEAA